MIQAQATPSPPHPYPDAFAPPSNAVCTLTMTRIPARTHPPLTIYAKMNPYSSHKFYVLELAIWSVRRTARKGEADKGRKVPLEADTDPPLVPNFFYLLFSFFVSCLLVLMYRFV